MTDELEDPELLGGDPEEEEGPDSLDNDLDLQREVLDKLKTHNAKGRTNRMAEVQNARDCRLYCRNIQQFYWSEDTQDVVFESDDDSPYDRTFNVIQGYWKMFIATFMGAMPKVRAEADDPFDSTSIRNTAKAQTYQRIYRKYNDTPKQQLEVARLMFTDGRVITRNSQRNGKEITEFWGVLESRVAITTKEDIEVPLKNCPLIELEDEYPIVQLKRDYGDKTDKEGKSVRGKINSGNGDSYERNARNAVKRQAGTDTSIDSLTGEDSYGNATKTWSYMRPEFFEDFQESSREDLKKRFSEGLCMVHTGEVYLESYACDPDCCLDVLHALPGDGMSRGPIGQTSMALQDSVNTAQNLIEETFDHAISTTYYDKETNIDSLNKQSEMPGASRVMVRRANSPASDHFFETTPAQPPQVLINYLENVKGPQMQFVTAMQPALNGAEMADQKTASGYAQARAMALGQMAIVWRPFTAWFARDNTRAIKLASKGTDEIKANLPASRKGGKPQAVKLLPSELQGLSFTNDSDENFPQTWTEKSNKFMQLLEMGGPISDMVLDEEPDNLYLAKQFFGLEELVIPGEDLRNNVLADISQMENEKSEVDPKQMPEQPFPAMGQPPVQPTLVSSIQIDTEYLEDKDFEIGWKTVKRWILSPVGQEAKVNNPDWVKNVRLYGLQYKAGMEAAQKANTPPQPEPPPGVTIPYDSLPVSGKLQAAGQRGIQLTPQDIASVPPKTPGTTPAGVV